MYQARRLNKAAVWLSKRWAEPRDQPFPSNHVPVLWSAVVVLDLASPPPENVTGSQRRSRLLRRSRTAACPPATQCRPTHTPRGGGASVLLRTLRLLEEKICTPINMVGPVIEAKAKARGHRLRARRWSWNCAHACIHSYMLLCRAWLTLGRPCSFMRIAGHQRRRHSLQRLHYLFYRVAAIPLREGPP
jgi:hypothetical protein